MTTQRVYLIRHGETTFAHGKFYGSTDVPLSKKGKEQAKEAALTMSNLTINLIASSPLRRAVYGASLVLEHQEKKQGRKVHGPVITPHFQEVHRGRWVGLDPSEVEEKFPGDLKKFALDNTWTGHGGESYKRLSERAVNGFKMILSTGCENICIVCHCFVIKVLVAYSIGLEPTAGKLALIDIPIGSITRLDCVSKGECPTAGFIGALPSQLQGEKFNGQVVAKQKHLLPEKKTEEPEKAAEVAASEKTDKKAPDADPKNTTFFGQWKKTTKEQPPPTGILPSSSSRLEPPRAGEFEVPGAPSAPPKVLLESAPTKGLSTIPEEGQPQQPNE